MEDKEIERILQEKADEIKLRDFSEVWQEIKGQIEKKEEVKPKWTWKKWLPMALASAVLIVCIALSPMIIKSLQPATEIPEEVFFTDELTMQDVFVDDMFNALHQAKINHVNLSNYEVSSCGLFVTDDNIVKGASFVLYNIPAFFANMQLYDKSVDLGLNLEMTYNETCKINSTTVHYKFKQESGGMYEYSIFAVHNNVQYVIEYTGVSNNLSDFLNEFFA